MEDEVGWEAVVAGEPPRTVRDVPIPMLKSLAPGDTQPHVYDLPHVKRCHSQFSLRPCMHLRLLRDITANQRQVDHSLPCISELA